MSDLLKVVAPRVVEYVSTVDGLVGLFFEAAETERKMPPAGRRQIKTMWPDVVVNFNEAYGWNDVEVRMGPANNAEVTRYDWSLIISELMSEDERKIVWAAAHSQVRRDRGPRWKTISKFMHCHPETAKRRFERAVLQLWFSLVDLTCQKA